MTQSQKKWRKLFLRTISILVLTAFFGTNLATGQPPAAISTLKPSQISDLNPLLHLQIPEEMGRVHSLFKSDQNDFVVLIQDAHAVPAAQKNIQKLISYLQRQYGFKVVGLEGASKRLDVQIFKSFPEREILSRVLDVYSGRGELPGGVAAAILNDESAVYQGVEDWNLYQNGLLSYLDASEKNVQLLTQLETFEKKLESEKQKVYSKTLFDIDRGISSFYENKNNLPELFEQLGSIQKPAPGSELAAFANELSAESEMDRLVAAEMTQLTRDIQSLLTAGKTAIYSKSEHMLFNQKVQEFQTSKSHSFEFALFLKDFVNRHQLPVTFSNELNYVLERVSKISSLKGEHFFEAFTRYMEEVKASLLKTDKERFLDQQTEKLRLLNHLAKMELNRGEWNKVKALLHFQSRLPAQESETIVDMNVLSQFHSHIAFYESAEKREEAFFKHARELLKLSSSPKFLSQNTSGNKLILVAGGFHAEGLAERLKNKKISYATVIPKINDLPDQTLYQAHMKGDVSWKKYFKVRDGKIHLYDAFVRGVRDDLIKTSYQAEGLSGSEENESYRQKLIGEWKDNLIKDLLAQGRADSAYHYLTFLNEISTEISDRSWHRDWISRINHFFDGLDHLKAADKLTRENVLKLISKSTMGDISYSSAFGETLPANRFGRFLPKNVSAAQSTRSEARKASWVEKNVPELSEYTMISRQIEAGLHEGVLQRIEEGYDEKAIAAWVAQTVLTGGLGALMGDDFEAQALNGMDIVGINVIYEKIKGQKYVSASGKNEKLSEEIDFGDVLRKTMRKTNHRFQFKLDIDDDFRGEAAKKGSKALRVANKELTVEVYETITEIGKVKLPYLYIYYEDENGQEVNIMDESYSDDFLWRDVQLAAYNIAGQLLIKQLQEGKEIKEKIIFQDNEVFASLPTPMFPDAIHHHRNHTVFRPGIYMPSEFSYDMLQFPEYLRSYIVQTVDGQRKINIVDAVAMTADFITGVGLYEHTNVLGRDLLAGYIHKLKGYYNSVKEIRSTNGVLVDRWQAPEKRDLINQYLKGLGLISELPLKKDRFSTDEYDQEFYDALQLEENKAALEEFKLKSEFVNALYVGDFLIWLAEAQGNPIWFEDTKGELKKQLSARNIEVSEWMTAGNLDMEKAVQSLSRMILQAVREDSDKTWNWLLEEHNSDSRPYRLLVEALIEIPIFSNVRRQVAYKGPEKWSEFLIRKPALEVLGKKSPEEVLGLLESLREDPWVKNKAGLNAFIGEVRSATQMSLVAKLSNGFDIWKNAFVYSDHFRPIRDEAIHTNAMAELKNQKWRKINGGRIFSEEADLDFESIKRLIKILGLEHHIATIENYSNYEAPIIFRAMAATVMLSDEFLEASATSMMKGLTNFGALIIVWGGAGPELLNIVDKSGQTIDILKKNIVDQNGQIVDVLKARVSPEELWEKLQNGTWKTVTVTYEILQENLRNGNWRITNGWLVDYSEMEMSRERGGGRRPSVASLYTIVKALSDVYRDPNLRRALQFNALATSPRVNMKTSQARANLYLWRTAIRKRRAERQLFENLKIAPKDVNKILTSKMEGFRWLMKHDVAREATVLVQPSEDGFFGFVEGFRHLRVKGTEAFWSIAYHAHHNDVFNYLLNYIFIEDFRSFAPIRKKLKKLQRKALKAIQNQDDYNAVKYNLEALEIVDRFALQVSWELFRVFEGSKKRNFAWNLFQENKSAVHNLIRYLDLHTIPLESSSRGIHLYMIPDRFPPTVVAVNESTFRYKFRGAEKARTELYGRRSFENLLGESYRSAVIQVVDSVTREKYKSYSVAELLRGRLRLPVGVPETNIQVLHLEASGKKIGEPAAELKSSEEVLLNYMNAAVKGILIEEQDFPERKLEEHIMELRKKPAELHATLTRITSFDLDKLQKEVEVEVLPALMALITILAPDLLGLMEKWESEIYNPYYQEQYGRLPTVSVFQRLQSLVQDKETLTLLQQSDFDFHHSDNEKALVFSKSSGARRIVVAMHLAQKPFRPEDGKGWFQILHMANLGIMSGVTYRVRNHLLNYDYTAVHPGQELLEESWHVGVPLEPREEEINGEIIEPPLHVQVLEMVEVPEKPEGNGKNRSELRGLSNLAALDYAALAGALKPKELGVAFPRRSTDLSKLASLIVKAYAADPREMREKVYGQVDILGYEMRLIAPENYISVSSLSLAYRAYDRALANALAEHLPAEVLGRKTSVVLSAEDPLAHQFLNPAVVKAVLLTGLATKIKVATRGTNFEDKWNSAILSKASPLSAEEKGRVFEVFDISSVSFSDLISQEAVNGAGVVLQTLEQFNVLDPRTTGLVSGIEELTTDRAAAELVIPIVNAAAVLGGFVDGRQLTKEELDRIQALLTRQLDELGIRLEVREGRLVGIVLVEALNRLLAEYQARAEVRKAA